jgi:hypothetical protein
MSAEGHGPISHLLRQHDTITRAVEEIPGGVLTTSMTSKPELIATLRTHVRQMAGGIRNPRGGTR